MSNFNNKTITSKGLELLSSALSGGKLEFTRIVMGDGAYEGDIGSIESLVSQKQSLDIKSITKKGSQVILSATLLQSEIATDFYWKELGIYAKGNDDTEVLYMYGSATDTSFISKDMLNEKMINVGVLVSNAQNVTATIDGSLVYLSRADLDDHDNDEKAHPSIKEWVNKLVGGIKLTWEGITGKPDTFPPSKHGHTASEVGALPIEGGELSGNLTVNMRVDSSRLSKNKQLICGDNDAIFVGNPDAPMRLESSITPSVFVNGSLYTMYHTGNKPTPAEIGASPVSHLHDDRYYTENEINIKLGKKADTTGIYHDLIAGGVHAKDNRNDNNPPLWYMNNHSVSTVYEFKLCYTISLKTNEGYSYCYLETHTPWMEKSGGYPTQIAYRGGGLPPVMREGIDDNTWGPWREIGGGSVIKSIQRGTAGSGTNVTVNISAVNLSKAIVLGGSTEGDMGTEYNPHSLARLIDSTTVQFVGCSKSTQVWQVIEFN